MWSPSSSAVSSKSGSSNSQGITARINQNSQCFCATNNVHIFSYHKLQEVHIKYILSSPLHPTHSLLLMLAKCKLGSRHPLLGHWKWVKDDLMRSEKDIEELDQLQLLRSGIEYGMSLWGKDHSWRQTRCVTNQCLTGTINIHGLWHFLGVTESLWACPKCKWLLVPITNLEHRISCVLIYRNLTLFTKICLYLQKSV